MLPKLGRLIARDPRDHGFSLAMVTPPPTKTSVTWPLMTPILDQGDSPMCVGFSWTQFLFCAPVTHKVTELGNAGTFARTVYRAAQKVDEWDGEDYEGTSVRAGAKVLQSQGRVVEYRWATSEPEIRNFVLTRGPVIIGINWYWSMFDVTPFGFVEIKGKAIAGGHAILVAGYQEKRNAYRLVNSWGRGWGQSGRAWLKADDMERLVVEEGGECCSATEIKLAT
jgi:hypothetical protein